MRVNDVRSVGRFLESEADPAVKSDSNLIFNRLKQLNSVHRILLTGTPLNNNLRELFNLLNFLDPEAFR